MKYKNTVISLATIVAIGIIAWPTLSYRQQNPTITQVADLPDAFMEDVTATIMNKQGRPSMKIITPRLVHYAKDDTTHFTTPELTLYRKSPQPWHITSQYAKATQGIDNVNFWENVMIHHSADGNNPATLIKTPTLTVYPNKQIAETSDSITLIQPNIVVKALGMHADMNTGDIKLLSKARGEYAPNS